MSVFWDHDIRLVPKSKKVPYCLYIVRPHAPKGTPGVYAEFYDFHHACDAAKADVFMRSGMRFDPTALARAVPRIWRKERIGYGILPPKNK